MTAGSRNGICRMTRTGVIKRLVVLAVGDERSRFAVVLKLDDGRRIRIHLVPPVVECQFLFQVGRRVTLPIVRCDGQSHLRLDHAGLKMLKKSGVYDPLRPCLELAKKARRRGKGAWRG